MLFDQLSRYDAAARGVLALCPDGGTVLDVGSGPLCLLGRFLPRHEVHYLDPLLEGREQDGVQASDLHHAVLEDGAYDVVVCVDTLEHVPPQQRPGFLEKLLQSADKGVVLAMPCLDVGDAVEVDRSVNEIYRKKTGKDYSWLEEHFEHGLPRASEILGFLADKGWHHASFGNGHAPWLRELLGLHVLLLDEPGNLPLMEVVGDLFQQKLLKFDHLAPSYRQVIVASPAAPVSLAALPEDDATRELADAAWKGFFAAVTVEVARLLEQGQEQPNEAREGVVRAVYELVRAEAALQDVKERAREQSVMARKTIESQQDRIRDLEVEVAALRSSFSWQLTAPLRMLCRGIQWLLRPVTLPLVKLGLWAARRLPLSPKWEWRLKSVFFFVLRPLLSGTRECREFLEAAKWRSQSAGQPGGDDSGLAGMELPEPRPDREDVVVFGVISWGFRIQRPQHLARLLAERGHRIFYIAPVFIPHEHHGYGIVPVGERIFEIRLRAPGQGRIYDGTPAGTVADHLAEGLRLVAADVSLSHAWVIVNHPCWLHLARMLPRSKLVYDCMDNHRGFAEAGSDIPEAERELAGFADLLVVTSQWLEEEHGSRNTRTVKIHNGCDPEHFHVQEQPAAERPVIGYFGAIAEWFDVDAVAATARALPHCDLLLVGNDTAGAQARLGGLENVRFLGEVAYEDLPQIVAGMDICLVPFAINNLTRATNPVKVYEALAAGKPVVATPLPELQTAELKPWVHIAESGHQFVAAVEEALATARDPARITARREFALAQSWQSRVDSLEAAIREVRGPRVTVVIVTWNNANLTERCLRSVLDDPARPDLEIVVVDNASSDHTAEVLAAVEADERVQVVCNGENLGFSRACNQGLERGRGDILVILNNDVVVTPGWTWTLHRHFQRDPSIGLLGPITNNIGNEARVPTSYRDMAAMAVEQARITAGNAGQTFDIPVLAFFCVAMTRSTYEAVGGLDEQFGLGFFEDDDYCQRVRALGRRVACAEDVFVHHELSASFKKVDRGERDRLFERNKAYYESKWGAWQAHRYREQRVHGALKTAPDAS